MRTRVMEDDAPGQATVVMTYLLGVAMAGLMVVFI